MAQIGSYEILDELGRGAMGVVFRALDPVIGRTVAMKVIRSQAFGTDDETQSLRLRFTREAAAAGRLSHPNIVTVYHAGTENDAQFLVMELVEGTPLDRPIASGELLSPAKSLPILRQIASALDYAHSQGIFHRDIKPANVLLRPDGEVKLTDFGIAHIASQTVTQTGVSMGTPSYMSPEQINGSRIDGRTDQFSLAVVAFEMLTGKKPFAKPTTQAVMFAIVSGERPFAHEANPALRPRVSEVLQRGLAKDPADRFPDCGEFAAALDAACVAPGVVPGTKNRMTVFTVVLLIAAMAGLGVWYLPIMWKAGIPTTTEPGGPVSLGPVSPPKSPPPALTPLTKVNPKDGLRYVYIPADRFMMGCSPGDTECDADEKPPHQETITRSFWMNQTEVTQAAYQAVMENNPSHFKGDRLPVETVTWTQAQAYCGQVGMRLPTEAEWEYAARGGEGSARYGSIEAVAQYRGNSGNTTRDVSQKDANRYGLHDMLGNVWEWVGDWYDSSQKTRVLRGGSWFDSPALVRVSRRLHDEPESSNSYVGFRCAGDLP